MKESRVLQLVWQLTVLLCSLEIGYGIMAGSLGLVSDGVHTAANCLGVGTSLFAVRWGKSVNSKSYSYGVGDRAEVLAAFTNSVILFILSAFLSFEAIHQLVESAHHTDHNDHVAFVALMGVFVNFVGLRFISPLLGGWRSLGRRLTSQHDDSTDAPRLLNLEAVALHIIFDIASSIGVIISSVFVNFGIGIADPLVAVAISALTIRGVSPLFKRTARILAQGSSLNFRADNYLRELSAVEGVLEFYQVHFWSLAPGREVGSLVIRVRTDADVDFILKSAHQIFASSLWALTVQIEKEKAVSLLPMLRMDGTNPSPATALPSVGYSEAARLI